MPVPADPTSPPSTTRKRHPLVRLLLVVLAALAVATGAPLLPPAAAATPDEALDVVDITGPGGVGWGGDRGPAIHAGLAFPRAVASDNLGNLYVADTDNDRVRQITPGGTIRTIGGGGTDSGAEVDWWKAKLERPSGVAVDRRGVVYIADQRPSDPNAARIVTYDPATSKIKLHKALPQFAPSGIDVAADGSVYFADMARSGVFKIAANGALTQVAGRSGPGYNGDNIPAVTAVLNRPLDVKVGPDGSVYIADTRNNRVRKIDTAGTITTVFGTGTAGTAEGPSPTLTQTFMPVSVDVDAAGTLLVGEYGNRRIRAVYPGGVVRTVTSGVVPDGLAVDATGNVIFTDVDAPEDDPYIRKALRTPVTLPDPPVQASVIPAFDSISTGEWFGPGQQSTPVWGRANIRTYLDGAGNTQQMRATNPIEVVVDKPTRPGTFDLTLYTSRARVLNPEVLAPVCADTVVGGDRLVCRLKDASQWPNGGERFQTVVYYGLDNKYWESDEATADFLLDVGALGPGAVLESATLPATISDGASSWSLSSTWMQCFQQHGFPYEMAACAPTPNVKIANTLPGFVELPDPSRPETKEVRGTVTVSNFGDVALDGTAVARELSGFVPAGITDWSAIGSGWTCSADAARGPLCRLDAPLAPVQSISPLRYDERRLEVRYTVPADYLLRQFPGQAHLVGEGKLTLKAPTASAAAADGSVLVADTNQNRVVRVDADGNSSNVVGVTGQPGFGGSPVAVAAKLTNPAGVAIGARGDVIVADQGANQVVRVGTDGSFNVLADQAAGLRQPQGITVDQAGDVIVADRGNSRVVALRLDAASRVARVDTLASGFTPIGVSVAPDGRVIVTDYAGSNTVKAIGADGTVTTIAGNGSGGHFPGDAPDATAVPLAGPTSAVAGPDGSVYFNEIFGHRVRRVAPDGSLTTVAGTGGTGNGFTDPAAALEPTRTPLSHPDGLSLDTSGRDLYVVAHLANQVVRVELGVRDSGDEQFHILAENASFRGGYAKCSPGYFLGGEYACERNPAKATTERTWDLSRDLYVCAVCTPDIALLPPEVHGAAQVLPPAELLVDLPVANRGTVPTTNPVVVDMAIPDGFRLAGIAGASDPALARSTCSPTHAQNASCATPAGWSLAPSATATITARFMADSDARPGEHSFELAVSNLDEGSGVNPVDRTQTLPVTVLDPGKPLVSATALKYSGAGSFVPFDGGEGVTAPIGGTAELRITTRNDAWLTVPEGDRVSVDVALPPGVRLAGSGVRSVDAVHVGEVWTAEVLADQPWGSPGGEPGEWTGDVVRATAPVTRPGGLVRGQPFTSLDITVSPTLDLEMLFVERQAIHGAVSVPGSDASAGPAQVSVPVFVANPDRVTVAGDVTVAHRFVEGREGTFAVDVRNDAPWPPEAPVVAHFTLPAELNYSGFAGDGWLCGPDDSGAGKVACLFGGAVAPQSQLPPLQVHARAGLGTAGATAKMDHYLTTGPSLLPLPTADIEPRTSQVGTAIQASAGEPQFGVPARAVTATPEDVTWGGAIPEASTAPSRVQLSAELTEGGFEGEPLTFEWTQLCTVPGNTGPDCPTGTTPAVDWLDLGEGRAQPSGEKAAFLVPVGIEDLTVLTFRVTASNDVDSSSDVVTVEVAPPTPAEGATSAGVTTLGTIAKNSSTWVDVPVVANEALTDATFRVTGTDGAFVEVAGAGPDGSVALGDLSAGETATARLNVSAGMLASGAYALAYEVGGTAHSVPFTVGQQVRPASTDLGVLATGPNEVAVPFERIAADSPFSVRVTDGHGAAVTSTTDASSTAHLTVDTSGLTPGRHSIDYVVEVEDDGAEPSWPEAGTLTYFTAPAEAAGVGGEDPSAKAAQVPTPTPAATTTPAAAREPSDDPAPAAAVTATTTLTTTEPAAATATAEGASIFELAWQRATSGDTDPFEVDGVTLEVDAGIPHGTGPSDPDATVEITAGTLDLWGWLRFEGLRAVVDRDGITIGAATLSLPADWGLAPVATGGVTLSFDTNRLEGSVSGTGFPFVPLPAGVSGPAWTITFGADGVAAALHAEAGVPGTDVRRVTLDGEVATDGTFRVDVVAPGLIPLGAPGGIGMGGTIHRDVAGGPIGFGVVADLGDLTLHPTDVPLLPEGMDLTISRMVFTLTPNGVSGTAHVDFGNGESSQVTVRVPTVKDNGTVTFEMSRPIAGWPAAVLAYEAMQWWIRPVMGGVVNPDRAFCDMWDAAANHRWGSPVSGGTWFLSLAEGKAQRSAHDCNEAGAILTLTGGQVDLYGGWISLQGVTGELRRDGLHLTGGEGYLPGGWKLDGVTVDPVAGLTLPYNGRAEGKLSAPYGFPVAALPPGLAPSGTDLIFGGESFVQMKATADVAGDPARRLTLHGIASIDGTGTLTADGPGLLTIRDPLGRDHDVSFTGEVSRRTSHGDWDWDVSARVPSLDVTIPGTGIGLADFELIYGTDGLRVAADVTVPGGGTSRHEVLATSLTSWAFTVGGIAVEYADGNWSTDAAGGEPAPPGAYCDVFGAAGSASATPHSGGNWTIAFTGPAQAIGASCATGDSRVEFSGATVTLYGLFTIEDASGTVDRDGLHLDGGAAALPDWKVDQLAVDTDAGLHAAFGGRVTGRMVADEFPFFALPAELTTRDVAVDLTDVDGAQQVELSAVAALAGGGKEIRVSGAVATDGTFDLSVGTDTLLEIDGVAVTLDGHVRRTAPGGAIEAAAGAYLPDLRVGLDGDPDLDASLVLSDFQFGLNTTEGLYASLNLTVAAQSPFPLVVTARSSISVASDFSMSINGALTFNWGYSTWDFDHVSGEVRYDVEGGNWVAERIEFGMGGIMMPKANIAVRHINGSYVDGRIDVDAEVDIAGYDADGMLTAPLRFDAVGALDLDDMSLSASIDTDDAANAGRTLPLMPDVELSRLHVDLAYSEADGLSAHAQAQVWVGAFLNRTLTIEGELAPDGFFGMAQISPNGPWDPDWAGLQGISMTHPTLVYSSTQRTVEFAQDGMPTLFNFRGLGFAGVVNWTSGEKETALDGALKLVPHAPVRSQFVARITLNGQAHNGFGLDAKLSFDVADWDIKGDRDNATEENAIWMDAGWIRYMKTPASSALTVSIGTTFHWRYPVAAEIQARGWDQIDLSAYVTIDVVNKEFYGVAELEAPARHAFGVRDLDINELIVSLGFATGQPGPDCDPELGVLPKHCNDKSGKYPMNGQNPDKPKTPQRQRGFAFGVYADVQLPEYIRKPVGMDPGVHVIAAFSVGSNPCFAFQIGEAGSTKAAMRPLVSISEDLGDAFVVNYGRLVVAPRGCVIGDHAFSGYNFDLEGSIAQTPVKAAFTFSVGDVLGAPMVFIDALVDIGEFRVGDVQVDRTQLAFAYYNVLGEMTLSLSLHGGIHFGENELTVDVEFSLVAAGKVPYGFGVGTGKTVPEGVYLNVEAHVRTDGYGIPLPFTLGLVAIQDLDFHLYLSTTQLSVYVDAKATLWVMGALLRAEFEFHLGEGTLKKVMGRVALGGDLFGAGITFDGSAMFRYEKDAGFEALIGGWDDHLDCADGEYFDPKKGCLAEESGSSSMSAAGADGYETPGASLKIGDWTVAEVRGHITSEYAHLRAAVQLFPTANAPASIEGKVFFGDDLGGETVRTGDGRWVQAQKGDFFFAATNIGLDLGPISATGDAYVGLVHDGATTPVFSVAASARIGLLGAEATVSGRIESDGGFEFAARMADFTVGGYGLNEAEIVVRNDEHDTLVSFVGDIDLPLVSARISGTIGREDGMLGFRLDGRGRLGIDGFVTADADLHLSTYPKDAGLRAGFEVTAGDFMRADVTASITPRGLLWVSGRATVGIPGVHQFDAGFVFTNCATEACTKEAVARLTVHATTSFLGATFHFAANIPADGKFDFHFLSLGNWRFETQFLNVKLEAGAKWYIDVRVAWNAVDLTLKGEAYVQASINWGIFGTTRLRISAAICAAFDPFELGVVVNVFGLEIPFGSHCSPVPYTPPPRYPSYV